MSGILYVVATPIGNLEDLSPRAVRTLQLSDLIACEDTRHTRKLLTRFSIGTPTTSYHEHNEESKTRVLLAKLTDGKKVALVSDAGTPLLSDPGYRLVRSCREQGIPVVAVPGPFAGAAACSVSGLSTSRILFVGFLAPRAATQGRELKRLAQVEATLVFYLSPHRLQQTLARITGLLGDRRAYLVREMTKLHETSYWGPLSELAERVGVKQVRGEYTLVVERAEEGQAARINLDVRAYVSGLVHTRGITRKEAIRLAAEQLGMPKRKVYELAVDPKGG